MEVIKGLVWIAFALSVYASSLTINDLVNGIEYVGWDLLLIIIPFGLSITCFFYLFQGWFEKTKKNKSQPKDNFSNLYPNNCFTFCFNDCK